MKSSDHIAAKNKNSGGNQMSLKKRATRRLSLLAGSSLVVASLAIVAGVSLAPSAAFAANECGDPSANGSAADVLVCPPGSYPAGIDYSATTDGNLTVILRDRVDTGTSITAGVGGIRLFGKTNESMSLLREDTPGVLGDPRIINTTGRGIDVTTQGSGSALINLTDGDPTGEPTTPTATAPAPLRLTGGGDAIRAQATGAGNVSVIIAETGTASGANHPKAIINAGALAGSNGSGVVARSTSGAINVDVRGANFTINGTNGGGVIDALSTTGNISIATSGGSGRLFGIDAVSTSGNISITGAGAGRLRGILAQTGGAGTVNLTVTGGVNPNATAGEFGIGTVAGTGSTLINISSGGVVNGGAGAAIRSVSASTSTAAAVNVQNSGTINGWVDFSGVSAGGVTFNNTGATATAGRWSASGTSTFSAFNDTVTLGGVGVNNSAAGTIINFGAGNDAFNIAGKYSVTTIILVPPFGRRELVTGGTTLNFGSGVDTMNISGVLTVDYMTVTGLEVFNNSGLVLLGAYREGNSQVPDYEATDEVGDDVLSLPGVAYTGSGSARLGVDVLLSGGSQLSCASPTGVGDCLYLPGGSTSGSTLVTATYIGEFPALGGYDPVGITVVDVAGGTSAAEHFTLDPNSAGYADDPLMGGTINRPGLFRYALRYDPASQRHAIVGLPRTEVLEYAVLSGAAQSIWHMTTDAVTDRQMDMRKAPGQGAVWLRTAGEYTQREIATDLEVFADTLTVDNSYKLYAGTVMGGMDLITGTSGEYDYVLGAQIGYVASSFDLDASETSGRFSGATGGVYGSLWTNRIFLDGAFNMNGLALDYESPGLGSKTTTYVNSIGARLDGGMRWMLGARTFVEPLATLAFARTSFEEISLSGGEVQPENANSRRGAVGLRLGADLTEGPINVGYFVAGRAWNEFAGQADGVVRNPGEDLLFTDEFTGGFGEVEAGLNLFNETGALSGFLTSGVKFKNGYDAVNLSLGLNMRW